MRHMRVELGLIILFFSFFSFGLKGNGPRELGRVNLARFFIFRHFFLYFSHFVIIIQNLQNKIKSRKNLKNTIITSIKQV